jgi:hypothetical protein
MIREVAHERYPNSVEPVFALRQKVEDEELGHV